MQALLHLQGIGRSFTRGGETLTVLQDIDLVIHAGTMVAIMGPSGSGKSTLLNILGCLDVADAGSYRVAGVDVAGLDSDARARLRLRQFGFVFQRYHLLPYLSALDNVALPASYTGQALARRRRRAADLLAQFGLGDRQHHLPTELSGGQQQRVSVARALINGAPVLLADEPTGALDHASAASLMQSLHALQAQGHTVLLVTHDRQVAAHAERIIELDQGRIVADRPNPRPVQPWSAVLAPPQRAITRRQGLLERLAEALKAAGPALQSHPLRTALTLLGIVIGVASVVGVVALGDGAQQHIRDTVGSLAGRQVEVHRGEGWSDARADSVQTLRASDVTALREQGYVAAVSPLSEITLTARQGRHADVITVSGVGVQFLAVRGMRLASGRNFREEEIQAAAQVAIIDAQTRANLFEPADDPLGRVILLGRVPVTVIGITDAGSVNQFASRGANLLVPSSTAGNSLLGRPWYDSVLVRLGDGQPAPLAETAITRLLTITHGRRDFFTQNMDRLARTMEATARTTSTLLTVIGAISLLVGGVGVMNIMLVSVSERTREIGIRMAMGARQDDILLQFLLEAVLVCMTGGAVGVLLACASGPVFATFNQEWKMVFSSSSIVYAVFVAALTGITFGFLPAWQASRLTPVDALARE